ncbi:hypothetical protein I203_105745 [Kwoniella mangroviensis CBS 8507]|uniref:uncharacterized protein n=1 Tax=Kwoniella mangroviensis CBS 8507 TaxID=1296122 RepID=UPI00080D2E8D|nr:uncharacterized protein I203_01557 [Kwoniella mangroviensis CBS 8507]OCF69693.1 hypothetical protein I203_01557 [Kwoniella mangroviensis CBS 8507]
MQHNHHNEFEPEYDEIFGPAKIPTSSNGQGLITSRSTQRWDLDSLTKSSGNLITKASDIGMKALILGTEYATRASRSHLFRSATTVLNDTYSSLFNGSPTDPSDGVFTSPYMEGREIPITFDDRTIDLLYPDTNKISKLRRPYDPITNTFTDSDMVDEKVGEWMIYKLDPSRYKYTKRSERFKYQLVALPRIVIYSDCSCGKESLLRSLNDTAGERDEEAKEYLRGDRWYWSMETGEGKYKLARMKHTLDELTSRNRRKDDGFEVAYVQNDQEQVQGFLNTLEKAKMKSTTRSISHDNRIENPTAEKTKDKSSSPFSPRASRFLAGEKEGELID